MTPRAKIMAEIRAVCERHNVCMADVMGRSRYREHVAARYEAFYRLRSIYALSLPQIGRLMGRDHTVVWYGIRRHMEKTGIGKPVEKLDRMRRYREGRRSDGELQEAA